MMKRGGRIDPLNLPQASAVYDQRWQERQVQVVD